MNVDAFFNNPWVVGIGAGVLSGFLVAYISRLIFSRRDDREYFQKVSQANHEVLYAVRPGISEGIIPSNEILKRLVSATARKYGVDETDLHDLNAISSELVKEVMDSSFISASSKQQYCESLTNIREEARRLDRVDVDSEYSISARYRRQTVTILGMMVGVLTGLGAAFLLRPGGVKFDEPRFLFLLLLPGALAIGLSIAYAMIRDLKKMRLEYLQFNFGGLKAEIAQKEGKKQTEKTEIK